MRPQDAMYAALWLSLVMVMSHEWRHHDGGAYAIAVALIALALALVVFAGAERRLKREGHQAVKEILERLKASDDERGEQ